MNFAAWHGLHFTPGTTANTKEPDDPPPHPPRRPRLPPPRPHGHRLDRGDGRHDRPRLRARRRVQRRLRHARARSPRRPATSPSGSSTATRGRRSTSSGRTRRRRQRRRQARARRLLRRGDARSRTSATRRRPGSRRTGRSATTTLPLTVPGWEVEKEQGEQLIAAAEENSGDGLEIKLGGDPIYQAQEATEPRGARLPRRRDRPADRLRLGGRRRPAAGDRAGRARHLLRRPDRPARQLRRRPRLDDGRLGPDRDRRRDRLRAARPDPFPLARSKTARTATTRSSRRSPPRGAA